MLAKWIHQGSNRTYVHFWELITLKWLQYDQFNTSMDQIVYTNTWTKDKMSVFQEPHCVLTQR